MIAVVDRATRLLDGHRLTPASTLVLTERAARGIVEVLLPVFRDVIGQAYAEGREDRDRLRRERDEARELLAEVVDRAGGLLPPGTSPGPRLVEVLDRARAHLRQ